MTTLTLVQEHHAGGEGAIRVYASYPGGWGFQVVGLEGETYSEAAHDRTEIGRVEIGDDVFRGFWQGDFIDWAGLISAHRPSLQALADLHFRGTSSRLIV